MGILPASRSLLRSSPCAIWYSQNWDISQEGIGREVSPAELAEMMLELQIMGCHNINLVSPSHVVAQAIAAVAIAADKGLRLPLVYDTGGYDSPEALRVLDGIVDIYMPDMKYADPENARRYSRARDYVEVNLRFSLADVTLAGRFGNPFASSLLRSAPESRRASFMIVGLRFALHYAYRHVGDPRARRLMLLRAAAFLPLFRDLLGGERHRLPIDTFEALDQEVDPGSALGDIFATVSVHRVSDESAVGAAAGGLGVDVDLRRFVGVEVRDLGTAVKMSPASRLTGALSTSRSVEAMMTLSLDPASGHCTRKPMP